jgi:hypothetical protein
MRVQGRGRLVISGLGGAFLIGLSAVVSGCGTTSSMKPVAAEPIDLTRFERLLIQDFADEFSAKAKPEKRLAKEAEAKLACQQFADRIALEARKTAAFGEVVRSGEAGENTLVIQGAIQRYEEGSAALRLLIGFGAGSSYFDSRVDLLDGKTGAKIGSWEVDKNSWGLGGAIASTQTPEAFMNDAAEKVAKELAAAKKSGVFDPKAGRSKK